MSEYGYDSDSDLDDEVIDTTKNVVGDVSETESDTKRAEDPPLSGNLQCSCAPDDVHKEYGDSDEAARATHQVRAHLYLGCVVSDVTRTVHVRYAGLRRHRRSYQYASRWRSTM